MRTRTIRSMMKYLTVLVFALTVLGTCMTALAATAPTDIQKEVFATKYNDTGKVGAGKNQAYLGFTSDPVKKVTVSKTSVGTVKVDKQSYGTTLYFIPKKAGKTDVKVKIGSKTYTTSVTVFAYKNAVSKVKLASGKSVSGSAFSKKSVKTLKYSAYANKVVKPEITLKDGWKLCFSNGDTSYETPKMVKDKYGNEVPSDKMVTKRAFCMYYKKGWQWGEEVKKGSQFKISGGAGFWISFWAKNTKTGQIEEIEIQFS